ncbi:MAG: GAF domain-containing sensor histidine kinase [Candidatus Binatia bacterium]
MKKHPARKRAPSKARLTQKAVSDLGRALSSTLDLDAIFQELAKGVKAHIRYDQLSVHRVNNHKANRVFHSSTNQRAGKSMASDGSENSLIDRILRERNPILWKDARTEKGHGTEQLSQMGLRSCVGIPLIHQNEVLGSLHIASKRPRAYGAKELHFLASVGAWLASAMDHAHAYEKLKKHNDGLQMATEHKSQFLARMSHEIRTPLGVLLGFLDILHSGTLGTINEEQKTAVDKMQIQSRRLQKMINDVLNLSRIEEGTIPLEISTFPTEKIIDSLRTLADELQRKSELKVRWDIDPNLPSLTTDAPKLEEILQNLIVNAFKYTPTGEIQVRIKNHPASKSIEFVVEDTGLGISPQNIPKIFEGFHQIDATTSSQGVGLGLTIVRKYLELMKGTIQVESKPAKGSRFRITLPYTLNT